MQPDGQWLNNPVGYGRYTADNVKTQAVEWCSNDTMVDIWLVSRLAKKRYHYHIARACSAFRQPPGLLGQAR